MCFTPFVMLFHLLMLLPCDVALLLNSAVEQTLDGVRAAIASLETHLRPQVLIRPLIAPVKSSTSSSKQDIHQDDFKFIDLAAAALLTTLLQLFCCLLAYVGGA